ncbi:hypothetical protein DPMN_076539 [Dreissena polymorpha]|uniref:Uncharacterized protein n=1 Tax=Dreissena polymorpha TaxID=45954 RepID=A0A9D4BFU9_DREPO|nr:hypothetical protein DPMN_076539 [Dreissena polymorpha]
MIAEIIVADMMATKKESVIAWDAIAIAERDMQVTVAQIVQVVIVKITYYAAVMTENSKDIQIMTDNIAENSQRRQR